GPPWTGRFNRRMIRSGPWSAAMDVGGWLRSLGLGQYEAVFRASEIDADILPELTDIDLEKLGVPLRHRKRLLRAISGLAAAETSAAASVSTASRPHDAAERRPWTDPGAGALICSDLAPQSLGVEPRRQRRRADEIAEHHRRAL